jgi:hypothetical protein
MIVTTMHIERPEGTTVATGLSAQYDLAVTDPKDDLGHDRDYLLYDVYIEYAAGLSVLRRDVLVDDRNVDPLTGANLRLRVTGVEQFDSDHFEV